MLIFVACVIYIITQLFSIQNLLLLSCSQMLGGIAFFFLPYPFISFETFYKVNIKKTVKICKVIGGLLMISAVVFAVLFLYKANWAKYEIVKIFFKGKDYGQKI